VVCLDAVDAFDLSAFYAAYRLDGHGRPAHDPAVMVALLLYGYAIGERSSRRLERRCLEDVATRVICANQAPDHTTIARFRQRHERALAELFGDVLALCAQAGLVRVEVIAVDGTKLAANAAPQATRDYEQIAQRALGGERAQRLDAALELVGADVATARHEQERQRGDDDPGHEHGMRLFGATLASSPRAPVQKGRSAGLLAALSTGCLLLCAVAAASASAAAAALAAALAAAGALAALARRVRRVRDRGGARLAHPLLSQPLVLLVVFDARAVILCHVDRSSRCGVCL
jgi:transposase